ncbi:acetyl esterase/lipase [Tepidamorphus gemmatus]|uniref:Acetyl esterase/lipase n=1 Tax=Tepidamorphus gemmatus TaxID=747076 RepID=A0A4R3M5T6_9HYPH|nr:alpha/beta hydrolase [Tepidamorphus gemmatus]TCT08392.1 acetyl esterase/lipase [Tepidamorphus gemmatus]
MTGIDYEAEYNNRARVPEHPAIIEGWARDAAAFRNTASAELDLAYGPRQRNRVDLFFPAADRRVERLAIFIHGGYWQMLDKSYFSHLARGPLAHGIAVAMPTYTLCPEVGIGEIIEEMRALVRFLHDRYRLPMAVSGHSAGGHLAAALLATDWTARGLPEAVVPAAQPISGLFDLVPLVATTLNRALKLDSVEAGRVSPLNWPSPAGLALHAWVGGAESDEFLRQSREIVDEWIEGGVRAEYFEATGANHFTVIAPLAEPDSDMTRDLAALTPGRGG